MVDFRTVVDGNFDGLPNELYKAKCAIMRAAQQRDRRRKAARRWRIKKALVFRIEAIERYSRSTDPIVHLEIDSIVEDIMEVCGV